MINTRAAAANILKDVIEKGKKLDQLKFNQFSDQDQRFIRYLCYEGCRYFYRLQGIIHSLLNKPLKPKDNVVFYLLIIGSYQLIYTQTPNYAIINETVEATKQLKKPHLSGLTNKLLKEIDRQHFKDTNPLNHPEWLIKEMKLYYPEDYQRILATNDQQPSIWLSVNTSKISLLKYQQTLVQLDIDFRIIGESIELVSNIAVTDLPGFSKGWFWVQDISGQQLRNVVKLKPGMKVLDACAAPGSKSALLKAMEPAIELTALDINKHRLTTYRENSERLGFTAKITHADATKSNDWWDQQLFDVIVVDAPCSGSGVIRRHPDIKLLLKETQLPTLIKQQQTLLKSVLSLLKPGGQLIYSTCSILPEENDNVVNTVIDQLSPAPFTLELGKPTALGWTILPGQLNNDGFYLSKLIKNHEN